jgi:hypothetical protein
MSLFDITRTPYSSPDGKPASSGTHITIHTPTGPVPGTMHDYIHA